MKGMKPNTAPARVKNRNRPQVVDVYNHSGNQDQIGFPYLLWAINPGDKKDYDKMVAIMK
jgi:hypothetical protein